MRLQVSSSTLTRKGEWSNLQTILREAISSVRSNVRCWQEVFKGEGIGGAALPTTGSVRPETNALHTWVLRRLFRECLSVLESYSWIVHVVSFGNPVKSVCTERGERGIGIVQHSLE